MLLFSCLEGEDQTDRDNIDEGSLPRTLQADQSKFNFFFPEKGAEPVQNSVDHRKHGWMGVLCT